MHEEKLSEDFKIALSDFFYADELVQELGVEVEEVIDAFEDVILDNLERLKERLGYTGEENEDNE